MATVTARLLDGIAQTDLDTAVRVLDEVRVRALEERTRLLQEVSSVSSADR